MKKEIFDFSEALRRMKEGKKVRRVIWKECGAYIHIISETIVGMRWQFLSLCFQRF